MSLQIGLNLKNLLAEGCNKVVRGQRRESGVIDDWVDKFKPCPICGGTIKEQGSVPMDQRCYVKCEYCGHEWHYGYSRKELLDRWANVR